MKILLSGATGLVGKNLLQQLLLDGHDVYALAREANNLPLSKEKIFLWSTLQPNALRGMDALIHLAGEPIAASRWTEQRKAQLRNSRCESTKILVQTIAKLQTEHRPKVFLSASAIGYYGDTNELERDEHSPPGTDFLATLTKDWENAALKAENLGLRVVLLRIGIILAKEGGALAQMPPVIIGNGQQWMSWIHIEDLVRFISYALQEEKIRGPYNMVSPEPVRNHEFIKALTKALKYLFFIYTPKFIIRLVLGEMSALLLYSQKILPKRAIESGFQFRYPSLKSALNNIYGSNTYLSSYYSAAQFLPKKRSEIFPFFSKAENLETLTPPMLHFHITKKSSAEIATNTLIDYKLKIHGIPVRWRTLISSFDPESSFTDEQLKGPYKKWHHVHLFDEVPGGTLMRDQICYELHGALLAKLLLGSWIRKDIEGIFAYRKKKIAELFP